jgi:hypothetical protein
MKTKLWRWLAAALFITPWLAGLGGASPASAAGNDIPFQASFTGTAAFTSSGAPVFAGSGQAEHMGLSTTTGYVVFTNLPPTCAGGVPNDNYETLTAANGDAFTIVSHDVACPTGPYQYHGSGDWSVVPGSGTGRFTGVSGQGSFDGHSDFYQGVFDMELSGTITEN